MNIVYDVMFGYLKIYESITTLFCVNDNYCCLQKIKHNKSRGLLPLLLLCFRTVRRIGFFL